MPWTITAGPEDVTYPSWTDGARWTYRVENRGQRVAITVEVVTVHPDPGRHPVLTEVVESTGRSVLAPYLEREGPPPTRFLVNSLGIRARA